MMKGWDFLALDEKDFKKLTASQGKCMFPICGDGAFTATLKEISAFGCLRGEHAEIHDTIARTRQPAGAVSD